jgi:hypothetical protein
MLTEDSIQSMGGAARAEALSPEQRVEIAKKAAEARWGVPKATHVGTLDLIGIMIPCYVLEDGRRVLSQRGLQTSIGLGTGGGTFGAHRMARIIERLNLKSNKHNQLLARINAPIIFKPLRGGQNAYGYEATILPDVCDYVLACRDEGLIGGARSSKMAAACDALVRALARVGIIALVDEATGYQYDRARNALAKILEKFIAKELQPWTRAFPIEFYEHIFRLRQWEFDPASMKSPRVLGKYTNNIVYARLAPGVLDELRRKEPVIDGRRKNKLYRWLTGEIGHPKLMAHLEGVKIIMRESNTWEEFLGKMDKHYPIMTTVELGFEIELKS